MIADVKQKDEQIEHTGHYVLERVKGDGQILEQSPEELDD